MTEVQKFLRNPDLSASKRQSLGLLDLRQRLHLGKHLRRHRPVNLDQRDGIAALLVAAQMEGRDVDVAVAKQTGEMSDESRLVRVGDIDRRVAEVGVDPDTLDVD